MYLQQATEKCAERLCYVFAAEMSGLQRLQRYKISTRENKLKNYLIVIAKSEWEGILVALEYTVTREKCWQLPSLNTLPY